MRFDDDNGKDPAKAARLAEEYARAHPDLRTVFKEFETWSVLNGLCEPKINSIHRPRRRNANTYLIVWKRLLYQARTTPEKLTPKETKLVGELIGLTPRGLDLKAMGKFSWHIHWTAGDLDVEGYSAEELEKVKAWWKKRCRQPEWELIPENHGTGPHIHVARRQLDWAGKPKEQDNDVS